MQFWRQNKYKNMGVSKNRGFPPKSSILIGFSIINHPFWGYPYFWKYLYPFSKTKKTGKLQVRHRTSFPATPIPLDPQKINGLFWFWFFGGRDYITPLWKAIYTWYISSIYCPVGNHMSYATQHPLQEPEKIHLKKPWSPAFLSTQELHP